MTTPNVYLCEEMHYLKHCRQLELEFKKVVPMMIHLENFNYMSVKEIQKVINLHENVVH